MSDFRATSIFPDDLETLEAAGALLFRHHENTAGIRLLALALRLREQTGFRKAGVMFACDDIDESAGMAEVVELHGYSRKAPCS